MKKIYQTPSTTIFEMVTTTLCVASIRNISGADDLDVADEGTKEGGVTEGSVKGELDWNDFWDKNIY